MGVSIKLKLRSILVFHRKSRFSSSLTCAKSAADKSSRDVKRVIVRCSPTTEERGRSKRERERERERERDSPGHTEEES